MSNGSDEWSPLSTARTVRNGKMPSDEEKDDDIFSTTRAPQIKREIVRKTVDDIENALCGIGSIYKIGKTLGEGSFATVKEATHKVTGAVVAIKIIEKLDSDKFEEQEICALGRINHPNCVTLHEVYESSRKLYLVTELMTGGTVMDRIIAQNHFSEKDSATAMVDVLHAVQYLHDIGLVHRDLKLENLMYASDDPASPDYHTVKLVDFGFAKTLRHVSYMKTQCGSPWNVAPEVLNLGTQAGSSEGYGPEVDLWAVGVMLYSMLCGFPPFYSESEPALARQIQRGEYQFHSPYWDDVSFGAKDLIASLLVVNPCRRFTCHQALEHPWIKNAVDASSKKLHSSYLSFLLLRKLAVFGSIEPACLEDVASLLQTVKVPPGEAVIRAGEPGDAMYFINAGAVQVALEGFPVDRLGAGNFFGELALTSAEERCADVVALGATGCVRCDSEGSPVGRRRADPTELFRLTRSDFEAVAGRFPALRERLRETGIARVRRACSESPQSSPLRSLYQRGFSARGRRVAGSAAAGAEPSLVAPTGRSNDAESESAAAARASESVSSSRTGSYSGVGGLEAELLLMKLRRASDMLIDDYDEEDMPGSRRASAALPPDSPAAAALELRTAGGAWGEG